MNIKEAKGIILADYLQSLGIIPCKKQGKNLWYYSPFREELKPSFKINTARNEWYDFGMGKGGNILDFMMLQNGTNSVSHALQIISGKTATIPHNSFSFRPQKSLSAFEDIDIQPFTNPALLQYLKERHIHIPFAIQICREIHYTVNGKAYFAIGFANDTDGYEIRNKYFKGCISPKGITTIAKGTDTCAVFEGFIDYLSYLTLKKQQNPQVDIVVLNSVALLDKAMDFLKRYSHIHAFLHNDQVGKQTLAKTKNTFKNVIDQSEHYKNHKDLNEFLCEKSKKHVSRKTKFKIIGDF